MLYATLVTVLLAASIEARELFIVNGTEVPYADSPYQGSWQILGSHACGCVMIAENWVLTAGHCILAVPISGVDVGFGSAYLNNSDGHMSYYPLSEIFRHPSYDEGPGFTPNDIAVARVASPITNIYSAAISMAPDSNPPADGTECYITGWGKLKQASIGIPNELQGAPTYILDDETCTEIMGTERNTTDDNYQPDVQICIYTGYNTACNGDSGGPLACNGLLYGVTSWGFASCPTDAPAVYTRVGAFREWVCSITGSGPEGVGDCVAYQY